MGRPALRYPTQQHARAMRSAERETRTVHLPKGSTIRLGALAGTDVAHAHVPDGHTGTLCMACFGWCNDARHWGRAALRTPVPS